MHSTTKFRENAELRVSVSSRSRRVDRTRVESTEPDGHESDGALSDERALVRRVVDGDEDAFRLLVEFHHPRIFRLVHGILGDWQSAEDVCQEVFVTVYRHLARFDFRSSLWTWLYRIAVRAALKTRRREARYRAGRASEAILDGEAALGGPAASGSSSALFAQQLEDREVVAKLLRPLPEHLRAVVWLRERDGLSYAEIADVLECSVGAVEQRLHRAYVQLRSIWKDRRKDLGLED